MAPPPQQTTASANRAMLLDFDGTVGATLPAWTEAFDTVLKSHGVNVPHDTVIEYCFHSCPDQVVRSHGIADADAFKERVWETVIERMRTVTPYPQVIETLEALKERGFKMAVVTNSRRAAVHPLLTRWEVDHLFDAVLTIEDVSHGKPDPEMIHRALNKLNVSPSEALIIGDSRSDVVAGKRAGIKTIGFSPSENWRYLALESLRFTEPSYLVHSYEELWDILGLHDSRG